MGNMERYFSKSFHEMSWNGPVIFMHWTMDVNTQPVEYITPNIQRILGYTPDELLSGQVPLISAIFEEDRDKFLDTMNQRIASKSPFWESSYRIYSKKGDIRFIKSYTYIKKDNSSDITSIFSLNPGRPGRKQQMPLTISLIGTPI